MICDTKYPILLLHGAGFRDRIQQNYWGRIPETLEAHGATIYYGNQDGWGSIEDNSSFGNRRIDEIIQQTGCGKVNIIAHSKGGVEARYIISSLGGAAKIASLTTISTPHHGAKVMDILLKAPRCIIKGIALGMNKVARLVGDVNPNFYKACYQLSHEYMEKFNDENPDSSKVFYQSYAAVMQNSFSDMLFCPLYAITYAVEGPNDGLVALKSARWTNFKGKLVGVANRGVSHADATDARRRNFTEKAGPGISDIRETYISTISELKAKGF